MTNFLFCGGVWAARGAAEVGLEGEMLLFRPSFVSLFLGREARVTPLLSEPGTQSFGIVPFPSGVTVFV